MAWIDVAGTKLCTLNMSSRQSLDNILVLTGCAAYAVLLAAAHLAAAVPSEAAAFRKLPQQQQHQQTVIVQQQEQQHWHSHSPHSTGILPDKGSSSKLQLFLKQDQSQLVSQPFAAEGSAAQQLHSRQQCEVLHFRKQCNKPGCFWCENIHAFWPGSKGVCLEASQVKLLPNWNYHCYKQPAATPAVAKRLVTSVMHLPSSAVQTAAAYPSVSRGPSVITPAQPAEAAAATAPKQLPLDPSVIACSTLHYREECHVKGCVWCDNKWSPVPGSDGVCIEEEYVPELTPWVYKCHIKANSSGGGGGGSSGGGGGSSSGSGSGSGSKLSYSQ
jgi:hypothetical protein